MKAFQELNEVDEAFDRSSSTSSKQSLHSTLWVGQTEASSIAGITIHETAAKLVLSVKIPEIDRVVLDVQVTQETVLIRGEWADSTEVEGFFRPSGFESLIPLPYAVQDRIGCAEIQPDGLMIQLLKQADQPAKNRLMLSATHNLSEPWGDG